jgi:CheY-like chemotaxis protein
VNFENMGQMNLEKVQMTILIVDDEPQNQRIVTMLLERHGHSVIVAENGEVALKKIAQDDFDLVFMDMQMPVLDGLETTRILRSCESGSLRKLEFEKRTGLNGEHLQGRHLHVIAITGSQDEQSKRLCLDAGMDNVLLKPFSVDSMNSILEQFGSPTIEESLPVEDKATEESKDLLGMAMDFLKMSHPLNDEMLRQLLSVSVLSLRQCLEDITQAFGGDDYRQVANGAHKIKGILLAIGVTEGVKICRSLQKNAEQKNVPQCRQAFKELNIILSPLLVETQ